MHATLFLGPRLYLVTYRRIDPLFTVDLSDPRRPRVVGFIKSPGFDEYLYPVNETLLIGVGRDGPALRVSLYKVQRGGVEVLGRVHVGGRGYVWSPVLDPRLGHRAFTFDPRHGYILLPVSGAVAVPLKGATGMEKVYGGVAVVKLDARRGGLELLGVLGHSGAARSVYIDDAIYTVSPYSLPRVKAFNATTLEPVTAAPAGGGRG